MKAVLIKRRRLTVDEIPEPTIDKNHILVATVASVISPGTERSSIEARSGSMLHLARTRPDLLAKAKAFMRSEGVLKTLKMARERISEPSPLGYSSAGIVVEVGEGIEDFKEGDRVACAGPHAELAIVPKNLALRMPEKMNYEEGAFVGLGGIALQGVRRADIRLGDSVVVIGLGIIGLLTVQIARASGAKVIAMDIVKSRARLAENLGANYASTEPEDIKAAVQHLTEGHGADESIVTASSRSNAPLEQAISLTRKKGRVVIVGAFPIELERQQFYEKELDLLISCSIGPGRYDRSYESEGIDYPYPYVRWTEKRTNSLVYYENSNVQIYLV